MTIEEIRKLSLEYAKGHVKTGPTWRTPRRNRAKERRRAKPETYAHWFGRSLKKGRHAGPPPKQPDVQTNAYLKNSPGELPPW